ncbi:MAG TPA: Rne/Rng family ribonuclease [Fimbriimonadales bacterium]|jgi:ribonuclease G|nr:Rne/Rng family ribonuclease [Fimbriimonadales bacterium]
MNKQIIVNVTPRETRIAVVENGQLMELRVEREERVVGSIYKGIVQNVLPGMDAAFVDIGLERNAFLYVADILPDEERSPGESPASLKRSDLRRRRITDLLRPGQELLVQVIKGPRGTKGARVSSRIAMPGRCVVLMPSGNNLGISKKIETREERERLRKIGDRIKPAGFGLIMRTECEQRPETDLRADVRFLKNAWAEVVEKTKKTRAPALVYRDQSLLYRTLRDMVSEDVAKVIIDDPDEFEKVHAVAEVILPDLHERIVLYDGETPIFDQFNIERDLEKLIKQKVALRSGGSLIIDEMEAITAIDINTGKQVGTTNLADTILRANLEAADEVGRQLRLRDIGGIIVVDFIDMSSASDRKKVLAHFQNVLKNDRARTRIGRISSLGLVEMTRKRTGESVTEALTSVCPTCEGRGRVASSDTVSLWIERDLRRAMDEPGNAFFVECSLAVCEALIGADGENVEELEHLLRRGLFIRSDPALAHDEYRIQSGTIDNFDKTIMQFRRAQVLECAVRASMLNGSDKAVGWTDDGYYIELLDGDAYVGRRVKICLEDIRRSFAVGSVIMPGATRPSM